MRLSAETQSLPVDRKELLPGLYLAASLVKVVNGCVITSVLNTTAKAEQLRKRCQHKRNKHITQQNASPLKV